MVAGVDWAGFGWAGLAGAGVAGAGFAAPGWAGWPAGGVCWIEGRPPAWLTPSGAIARKPAAIIVRMETNPTPRAGER